MLLGGAGYIDKGTLGSTYGTRLFLNDDLGTSREGVGSTNVNSVFSRFIGVQFRL